jgi:hypothetical protein
MKKSLQKTLLKTNEAREKVRQRQLEGQKEKEKQQKILEEKARKKSLLESLDKMSYNDLRKLASDAGITIYQRKKEEIKQDLKDYYEQLWAKSY